VTRGTRVRSDVDLEQVEAGLHRLEAAANKRVRMALQMGAELIVNHAKRNHEYRDRTGRLTQSIRAEQVEGTLAEGFVVGLSAGGLRVEYAGHIEFGTRPHVIRARKAKALRFTVGGQDVFRRQVRHPGTRAYRFMQNAVDAKTKQVEQLIEDGMDLAAEEAGF
jgi:hypothetical protein